MNKFTTVLRYVGLERHETRTIKKSVDLDDFRKTFYSISLIIVTQNMK